MGDKLRSICLAEAHGDEEVSEPFPVLYTGKFSHPESGEFTVTQRDLDKAVENFKALTGQGHELPIDYEHSFAEGKPEAPAAGWFKDLYREGKKLMARVSWTDRARKAITEDEYRYFSPEFTNKAKDEHGKEIGFALLSGGLTNRPHLKGLGPVALSEGARKRLIEEARELVGDEFIAGLVERAVSTKLAAEREAVAEKKNTDPASEKTPEKTEDKVIRLSEAEHKRLKDSADQVKSLTDKVETLTSSLETTQKELTEERFTAFMSQARREGRVDAKEETTEKWRERVEKYGIDEARSLMEEIPAETIAMSERGHGEDKPTDTEQTPDGVNPLAHKADQLARKYEEEKGISYREAASLAFKEVYGGAQ